LELRLDFSIDRQPTEETCGPTCLQAVYRYWGDEVELGAVLTEVEMLPTGGTMAVHLGQHALERGYRAHLTSFNLQIFDPTWAPLSSDAIADRLRRQAEVKSDPRLRRATDAYLTFLADGGTLTFESLTLELLRRFLDRRIPVLAGLSATYLYQEARERPEDGSADDVGGFPTGHFVVLCGYRALEQRVLVADPLHPARVTLRPVYSVPLDQLLGAVFLGALTYDANLLSIEPAT